LQSSARPEKGAGLAMVLATTGGEGTAAVDTEVFAGVVAVEVLGKVRRRAVTNS